MRHKPHRTTAVKPCVRGGPGFGVEGGGFCDFGDGEKAVGGVGDGGVGDVGWGGGVACWLGSCGEGEVGGRGVFGCWEGGGMWELERKSAVSEKGTGAWFRGVCGG